MLSLRRLATAAGVAASVVLLACAGFAAGEDNVTSGNFSEVTPAPPSTNRAVAYRMRMWAYAASYAIDDYRAEFKDALAADVAAALGVSTSTVTLNDLVQREGTGENITTVFVVHGPHGDAGVLTASGAGPAAWANRTNALLATVYGSLAERRALGAEADANYTSLYVNSLERLSSTDLPKTRYFEVVLEGKHLGAAALRALWNEAVGADLATAFGIKVHKKTHFNVTSQVVSGANSTTVTLRFLIRPVAAVAVDKTKFFGSRGTVTWISEIEAVHKEAAAEALGVSLARGAVAQAAVPKAEYAVTVTSTSYAPGDESYSAADGIARGVAVVGASVLMVLLSLIAF